MKNITLFFKLIFFTTLITSNGFAAKDTDIIATVNGKNISYKEFNETYKQNMFYVSDKVVSKKKVLFDLINRQLGIQRAKKNKLENEQVVKAKMEDILYHAQISKDLEPRLNKIVVTDKDVKDYYTNHPEFRTAHILFRTTANSAKNESAAAIEQALKVYNTLKTKPEKFAELANKYSQSSVAPNGGDMGFQPAIRLAPEYFKAIKGKQKGFITPPVRSQFGVHIIKVLAQKDFSEINMPLYKKIVYDRKRDTILGEYFENLQKNAKIDINEKLIK